MQLVERRFFGNARDRLVEVAVLGFQRLDLASYFFVSIHSLDHSLIGRRQCNKFLSFGRAGISM